MRHLGQIVQLAWACCRALPRLRRAAVAEQAWEVAGRSAFFIGLTLSCTGAIMVVQAAGQAAGVLGDVSPIGGVFVQLLVSDFGPLVTSLLLAARVGAGVAASLSAMVVTEQVDALRLCGAAPVPTLVAPCMWGSLLGTFVAVAWGSLCAYGAGVAVAVYGYGIAWRTFCDLSMTRHADLFLGLSKTALFGITVPLVSARAGLAAGGGAQAVGQATTQAVIQSSVALLLVDFVVSLLGYAWL